MSSRCAPLRTRKLAGAAFLAIVFSITGPLAVGLAAPSDEASAATRGSSVGTFAVSPLGGEAGGFARGSLVSGFLAPAAGEDAATVRDFAIASPYASATSGLTSTIFSSIDIDGFEATSELRGVGTSALELIGNGVSVTMMDSVNSLLFIGTSADATSPREVTFVTPREITLAKDAALDNVLLVSGTAENAPRGALILVSSDGASAVGAGSSIAIEQAHTAKAVLGAGAQVIFRADATYATAASAATSAAVAHYNSAVVSAIAKASLVGEATTDVSAGANLIANANAFAFASARTQASSAHRVTTLLRSEAELAASATAEACGQASATAAASATASVCARAHVLAYDLDYVNVPARTADNVAVYLDGALAQRVAAAAEVAAHAGAYWATTVDGRVLVLVNAAAHAQHATEITISAVSSASAAASTLAELDAEEEITAEVAGNYEMLGSLSTSASGAGGVIGTFSSFFADEARGETSVRDYTDLRSSTRIFSKIGFAAEAAADATASFAYDARAAALGRATASTGAAGSAVVEMATHVEGSTRVTTRFTDSVFATIEAQAEAATLVEFHLTNDVSVQAIGGSEQILQLSGPGGKLGHLILTTAEGGARSRGTFDLSAAQTVRAHLLAGEAVVFRSAAEGRTRASADVIVDAVARGTLASEASVGFVANAVSSASVDYRSHIRMTVDAATQATHRGQVALDVAADSAAQAQATLVSIVADRATLAARQASDIVVEVDGKVAASARSAADVAAAVDAGAAQATYFVTTNLNGQTQVLVGLPEIAAGSASRIVLASDLDARSRLDSALDVFGSFVAGYGGVAQGDIVRLVAREDVGLLLDYTVVARREASASEGTVTTVFDTVRLGTSALASAGAPSSTALRYENEEGAIEVFDMSSAVLKLTAEQATTARLDLAPSVTATTLNPNVIMIDAPDLSGAVILIQAGQATAAAGGATSGLSTLATGADGSIEATLEAGAEIVFKAFSGFESQLSTAERQAQANAIASGELIGHIIVRTDPATSVTSATAVNYYPAVASGAIVGSVAGEHASVASATAAYGAVQAITQVASSEKVELVVTSATASSKSIILSLDRNTVTGLVSGEAELLIDGQAVKAAATYGEALGADDDTYYVLTGGREVGLQVIVTLGHFSTRTITLESPAGLSMFLWTTIALGVVVVAQAVYPVIRRRAT